MTLCIKEETYLAFFFAKIPKKISTMINCIWCLFGFFAVQFFFIFLVVTIFLYWMAICMGTYWANSACACMCAMCMGARLCSTYFLVGKKIYMFMIFPSRNLLATLFSNVHGLVLWRAQTELCLYVSSVLVYLFRIGLFIVFFGRLFKYVCIHACQTYQWWPCT